MSESDSQTEAKLNKLGQRIREGCAAMPRLTQGQLDEVRKGLREQWTKEQHALKEKTESANQHRSAKQERLQGESKVQKLGEEKSTQEQTKSQSQRHGH